jgi:hypothetical protein
MKHFQEFALIASVLIPAITKISGDIQRKVKHLKFTRYNIEDPGGTFFMRLHLTGTQANKADVISKI